MAYNRLRKDFEKYLSVLEVDRYSKNAVNWWMNNAMKLKSASFKKSAEDAKFATSIVPGKFYLYIYDPKFKKELPVYDMVPFVLVTSITKKGWYGINFHYMPALIRKKIFELLLEVADDKRIPDGRKQGMMWRRAQTIASMVGGDKYLNQSIKQYLDTHVRSRFLEIPKEDWAMTTFLPLAKWGYGGKR